MLFIINPLTDKKVLLKSLEGKKIVLEYVKHFQEGGVYNSHLNIQLLQEKIESQTQSLRQRGICNQSGLICTYNIQGTFIDSGIFDGTLQYLFETPSIFCVQEIGGLSNTQRMSIMESKGGYSFRTSTLRQTINAYDISNIGIWTYENWTYIQYYWEGKNKGPKDTAILYNNNFYDIKKILFINFPGGGAKYRPIGGVLLWSKILQRNIAVFTIHMPSLGGGTIPDIYNSIITYVNNRPALWDIFLVGDFNLDSDTATVESTKSTRDYGLISLLNKTGSTLYTSSSATQQSGRKLDYIIYCPCKATQQSASVKMSKLHTLLSYNVASSDHSSLGLCLTDVYQP